MSSRPSSRLCVPWGVSSCLSGRLSLLARIVLVRFVFRLVGCLVARLVSPSRLACSSRSSCCRFPWSSRPLVSFLLLVVRLVLVIYRLVFHLVPVVLLLRLVSSLASLVCVRRRRLLSVSLSYPSSTIPACLSIRLYRPHRCLPYCQSSHCVLFSLRPYKFRAGKPMVLTMG